jgi:hypothetical protein
MHTPTLPIRALVCFAVALVGATSTLTAAPQELTEKEQRDLGLTLKRYTTAAKDADKAKDELVKALEKIGKKRAPKEADSLSAALGLTADLGKAVFYSGDYKPIGKGGKVFTDSTDNKDKAQQREYAISLPESYKSTGGPVPLILFIPGIEDGKVTAPAEFFTKYWTEDEVHKNAIMVAVTMPADASKWTSQDGIYAAMYTLGDVFKKYAVDRDRVYIVGRAEGAPLAVLLGSMYPQRFAGIVGNAGDAGDASHLNFQNLPTYFQGAGAQATAFEAKIKEAGYNNCTVKSDATVADMWSWIKANPRVSNPAKVTLSPGSPTPSKAYWIEIAPTENIKGVITGEADRASNTITIKATSVRQVTVYLNDVLVDLSKPINVVLNGHEQKLQLRRSLDDMLLMLSSKSDSGMLYVVKHDFDLPN